MSSPVSTRAIRSCGNPDRGMGARAAWSSIVRTRDSKLRPLNLARSRSLAFASSGKLRIVMLAIGIPDTLGRRQSSLTEFGTELRHRFAGRVYAFDERAAEAYGEIAAIARTNRMRIATRDEDDFSATGVPLINPWT